MIIVVSIVDKHRPKGEKHVGTYSFEIDYPAAEHNGQMDFMVMDCPDEVEEKMRPYLNQLLTKETMPDPVHGDGSPV